MLLYDFNSFHSLLFGNCANRVPTFLSAFPVQAGCNARSANAAHAAKAQSGKDLRPDSRCGPAQAAHQNQYIGQLPAQAKCKCGKPGCAQCFAIARLREKGITCLAAALYQSQPLSAAASSYPDGVCVVIGSEGQGLTDETIAACSSTVRIPMTDRVESLNAGIAGSILLWHFREESL